MQKTVNTKKRVTKKMFEEKLSKASLEIDTRTLCNQQICGKWRGLKSCIEDY